MEVHFCSLARQTIPNTWDPNPAGASRDRLPTSQRDPGLRPRAVLHVEHNPGSLRANDKGRMRGRDPAEESHLSQQGRGKYSLCCRLVLINSISFTTIDITKCLADLPVDDRASLHTAVSNIMYQWLSSKFQNPSHKMYLFCFVFFIFKTPMKTNYWKPIWSQEIEITDVELTTSGKWTQNMIRISIKRQRTAYIYIVLTKSFIIWQ